MNNNLISEIRLVTNLGFLCWNIQTPGLNVQDDALMLGAKLILKNKNFNWENTYSSYRGWLRRSHDYGNKPIVFSSKINFLNKNRILFLQYQKGLNHFPYHQIRLGLTYIIPSLTPNLYKS